MNIVLASFLNLTAIIPKYSIESNNWSFLLLGVFVFGIILGGLVKGLAKFVLTLMLFGSFIVLLMSFLGKNDLLSMIISVGVGLATLAVSFLAKLGKTYTLTKG